MWKNPGLAATDETITMKSKVTREHVWRTKKQTTVARSSVEAELRALASTVQEVIWLCWLLQDLDVTIFSPTPLHCDSTGALQVAADPTKHELTKHVGVDAHFTRCSVHVQIVSLHYLPTEVHVANFLPRSRHEISMYFCCPNSRLLIRLEFEGGCYVYIVHGVVCVGPCVCLIPYWLCE